MNKDNIKVKTNLKIGFANFERNEKMKRLKIKHFITVAIALIVFVSGMLTVNALTDNSIGNAINETVKNVLKVKINDKDYNANCQNKEDGTLVCTVDSNVLGYNKEVTIEKKDPNNDDIKLEFD